MSHFLCDVSLTMLTHSDAPLLEIQVCCPFYSHQNIWCLHQLKLLFSSWLFDVFIYKDFLFQLDWDLGPCILLSYVPHYTNHKALHIGNAHWVFTQWMSFISPANVIIVKTLYMPLIWLAKEQFSSSKSVWHRPKKKKKEWFSHDLYWLWVCIWPASGSLN